MNKKRYLLIDGIRGIAILNMIAFHFLYDLNEIIGAAGYMLDIHPGIGICLEDKQKNSCKTGDIFRSNLQKKMNMYRKQCIKKSR